MMIKMHTKDLDEYFRKSAESIEVAWNFGTLDGEQYLSAVCEQQRLYYASGEGPKVWKGDWEPGTGPQVRPGFGGHDGLD